MLNISLLVNGISYFYFQNSIFFMCILIFSHFENIMYFMLFIINELYLLGKGGLRLLLQISFSKNAYGNLLRLGWNISYALRLQLYNSISDLSIYDDLFWESENNILHCNSIFYCTKCTSIFTKKQPIKIHCKQQYKYLTKQCFNKWNTRLKN